MLLKGKPVADKNRQYCLDLIAEKKSTPHLVIFLIGGDPASEYYVNSVQKQSEKFGVKLTIEKHDAISEDELLKQISELNADNTVHGIMVQKPLPKNISAEQIDQAITPNKDIDGFHALNAGLMLQERDCMLPCTAEAILDILDFYEISVEGKHIVVVGRSNVVGKPIANLLLYKQKNRNATVTVCHSRTPDLGFFTKKAEILITAVGVAHLVKADMIREGVIIIDAGINEMTDAEGKTTFVGDVDFAGCEPLCSAITPVPGGVGSVTTSVLFKHVCKTS
jgi:methylenetetrahydrofolate dehydrogenase (NADP+)/methenyltetrahydrofolate cyclohydrolase